MSSRNNYNTSLSDPSVQPLGPMLTDGQVRPLVVGSHEVEATGAETNAVTAVTIELATAASVIETSKAPKAEDIDNPPPVLPPPIDQNQRLVETLQREREHLQKQCSALETTGINVTVQNIELKNVIQSLQLTLQSTNDKNRSLTHKLEEVMCQMNHMVPSYHWHLDRMRHLMANHGTLLNTYNQLRAYCDLCIRKSRTKNNAKTMNTSDSNSDTNTTTTTTTNDGTVSESRTHAAQAESEFGPRSDSDNQGCTLVQTTHTNDNKTTDFDREKMKNLDSINSSATTKSMTISSHRPFLQPRSIHLSKEDGKNHNSCDGKDEAMMTKSPSAALIMTSSPSSSSSSSSSKSITKSSRRKRPLLQPRPTQPVEVEMNSQEEVKHVPSTTNDTNNYDQRSSTTVDCAKDTPSLDHQHHHVLTVTPKPSNCTTKLNEVKKMTSSSPSIVQHYHPMINSHHASSTTTTAAATAPNNNNMNQYNRMSTATMNQYVTPSPPNRVRTLPQMNGDQHGSRIPPTMFYPQQHSPYTHSYSTTAGHNAHAHAHVHHQRQHQHHHHHHQMQWNAMPSTHHGHGHKNGNGNGNGNHMVSQAVHPRIPISMPPPHSFHQMKGHVVTTTTTTPDGSFHNNNPVSGVKRNIISSGRGGSRSIVRSNTNDKKRRLSMSL